jgi:hypothetical protein
VVNGGSGFAHWGDRTPEARDIAMGKTSLVNIDLELGEEILRRLDAAKFPAPVAFWAGWEERWGGEWQFVVGSPSRDKAGLGEAIAQSNRALRKGDTLSDQYFDFRILSNRDPIILDVRRRFAKSRNVKGARFSGPFGGTWIDDGVVYRIK